MERLDDMEREADHRPVRVPLADYSGRYDIAWSGMCRSIKHKRKDGIPTYRPLLPIYSPVTQQYYYRMANDAGVFRNVLCARLVADVFLPNPNNRTVITYRDGHADNWSLPNLAWGDE